MDLFPVDVMIGIGDAVLLRVTIVTAVDVFAEAMNRKSNLTIID